jgi:hypothetical protein
MRILKDLISNNPPPGSPNFSGLKNLDGRRQSERGDPFGLLYLSDCPKKSAGGERR